jgi:hypothetical protein
MRERERGGRRERERESDAGVANRGHFGWTRQMGFSHRRPRTAPALAAVAGNPRLFNGRTIASRWPLTPTTEILHIDYFEVFLVEKK